MLVRNTNKPIQMDTCATNFQRIIKAISIQLIFTQMINIQMENTLVLTLTLFMMKDHMITKQKINTMVENIKKPTLKNI